MFFDVEQHTTHEGDAMQNMKIEKVHSKLKSIKNFSRNLIKWNEQGENVFEHKETL